MEFAVVKIAGKQHLVKVGDSVTVEAPLGEAQKSLSFSEVLLLQTDSQLKVGTPLVEGIVVKAEVTSSGKGEKIRVSKFKSKVRYRKTIGFRPQITTLKITAIGGSSDKAVEKKATPVKKTSKPKK